MCPTIFTGDVTGREIGVRCWQLVEVIGEDFENAMTPAQEIVFESELIFRNL